MTTETGYCPVDGGELYYEAEGDPAGPALLFIHAGVADCSMWDAQVAHLRATHRVVRFDTRGYGRTRTDDVAFSNRADAIAVLDHVGVDKAALIGCSRGGQIAIDTTIEFPTRVRAVVPVAAGLSGFPFEPDGSEREKVEMAMFDQMEAAWEAKDWERLADLDVRVWADGPGQPEGRAKAEIREAVRRMCLDTYRNHNVGGRPIPLDPPAFGRLAEIRVPALVVTGDLDTSGVAKMGMAMRDGIAGARHTLFLGAAHLPSMEQPEAFNRVLAEFLSRALA